MIRALIFDLFDVLFSTELSPECHACEMHLQLADYGLRTAMLRSPQFREAIYGCVSEEVLWRDVASTVKASADAWQELADAFYSCVQVNTELLNFIRDLRPHYKTAILSNATPAVYLLATQQFCLDQEVDTIVISAQVGATKPHPEIYQIAAYRLSIVSHEAIYVDDERRFVEGAEAIGMRGVQFQNTAQVIAEVQTLLAGEERPTNL